jgi:hypothetical protein
MGSTADKASGLANEAAGKANKALETSSDRASSRRKGLLKNSRPTPRRLPATRRRL